jgi:hypothetical protein
MLDTNLFRSWRFVQDFTDFVKTNDRHILSIAKPTLWKDQQGYNSDNQVADIVYWIYM